MTGQLPQSTGRLTVNEVEALGPDIAVVDHVDRGDGVGSARQSQGSAGQEAAEDLQTSARRRATVTMLIMACRWC